MQMSNPIFGKNKLNIIELSSAEFAKRVVGQWIEVKKKKKNTKVHQIVSTRKKIK